MRRLEAERIGERRCGATRAARVGAGDAASMGLKSCPPTRVDGSGRETWVWCGARAPCLARTAPGGAGTRPLATMSRPRGAR